jgi:hypothetical protein
MRWVRDTAACDQLANARDVQQHPSHAYQMAVHGHSRHLDVHLQTEKCLTAKITLSSLQPERRSFSYRSYRAVICCHSLQAGKLGSLIDAWDFSIFQTVSKFIVRTGRAVKRRQTGIRIERCESRLARHPRKGLFAVASVARDAHTSDKERKQVVTLHKES